MTEGAKAERDIFGHLLREGERMEGGEIEPDRPTMLVPFGPPRGASHRSHPEPEKPSDVAGCAGQSTRPAVSEWRPRDKSQQPEITRIRPEGERYM